jgi:hypothetical protein
MDAKYNEFLYAESYTQGSRFVDFVYSWLSNFTLDKVTRKVSLLDPIEANVLQ